MQPMTVVHVWHSEGLKNQYLILPLVENINRIVMVANKFYQTPDKEETPAEPEKKTKKGKK